MIRTICFDTLYRHYRKWESEGFRQIINVGNHDQEDRAGDIHPMRVFSSFEGWLVVDKPTRIDGNIVIFPYMKNDEIEEYLNSNQLDGFDAFVHWGIRGAKRNDTNIDKDGVPIEWLKVFRNVFSGHYHYRSKYKNVRYIGSPFQQNFGEMGQEKGVIIYDSEENEESFVEIKGSPKHHEITFRWEEGSKKPSIEGDKDSLEKEDYCRIKVVGDSERVNSLSIGDVRKVVACDNISVEREPQDKHFTRLNISSGEIMNVESLMAKYVDFVSTDLDKSKLLDVGKKILGV
jgi:DNA repair exonuclease SbcCD nuclease subunit